MVFEGRNAGQVATGHARDAELAEWAIDCAVHALAYSKEDSLGNCLGNGVLGEAPTCELTGADDAVVVVEELMQLIHGWILTAPTR